MRGMVVEYYIELLIEGKLLPKQVEEIQHTFLVRGRTRHEQRAFHLRTDGAKDSHSVSSGLVQRPLDREILWRPLLAASHPHVEGRLVEVNDRLVIVNQSCEAQ